MQYINKYLILKIENCYASTFTKDIRKSYAIEEICRRL